MSVLLKAKGTREVEPDIIIQVPKQTMSGFVQYTKPDNRTCRP